MSLILLLIAALQTIITFVPVISRIQPLPYKGPEDHEALVPRIAIGDPVIAEFPFYVALSDCGGTIISNQWVLTAAHCVNKPDFRKSNGKYITIGGDNTDNNVIAKPVKIEKIFVHPQYADLNGMQINDIALIKLAKPLQFNDMIWTLKLPFYQTHKWGPYIGSSGSVFIGKGVDENGSLRVVKTDVRILSTENCFRNSFTQQNNFIEQIMPWLNDTTICSERVENLPGAGPGDSGGPLVTDGVLVGIASYRTAVPGHSRLMFLTNVEYYKTWIRLTTNYFGGYGDSSSEEYGFDNWKPFEYEDSSSEENEDSSEEEFKDLWPFKKYEDTSFVQHEDSFSEEDSPIFSFSDEFKY